MTYYQESVFLKERRGNNAFSYEERKNFLQKEPFLSIPNIIDGTIDDVKVGETVVFEEIEDEVLKSCFGLENFVRILQPVIPVRLRRMTRDLKGDDKKRETIIFDNHNHAYYFWAEARKRGLITDGATLIHIDQHKDMRDPGVYQKNEDLDDLEKVAAFTNEVLNVGNFIVPAREAGMIKDIYLLDAEMHFQQDFSHLKENIIVDIDLDIFAPELSFMDQEMILEKTRELVAKADFVTMATSPYFIEQKVAIEWAKRILG